MRTVTSGSRAAWSHSARADHAIVVVGGRIVDATVVGASVVATVVPAGDVEDGEVEAGDVVATVVTVRAVGVAVEGADVGGAAVADGLVVGDGAALVGAMAVVGDGVGVPGFATIVLRSTVGGMSRRSTAWSTPLATLTSGPVIVASLMRMAPLTDWTLTGVPSVVG